jgi:molecular chaperone HtpG
MRFLRGVVDSEDLPLNISRENLQYNATIERIKGSITKRVFAELRKKLVNNREEYENFWNNFGAALKEGLCEVTTDPEKILELCMFYSTKSGRLITLDEYISSLPEEHADTINKTIYYLSGDNIEKLKNSPQIEGFLEKGIDVLLFTDNVDDFWVNVAGKYKDYEIKSVTRSDVKITKSDNDQKDSDADDKYNSLIDFFKETLGDSVKDVIISGKLTNSPSCLSVNDGDMDIRMERFLIEQNQLPKASAKILEINPKHAVVGRIISGLANDQNDLCNDLVWLLFDQACILEGEPVKNPHLFSNRLIRLMSIAN